MTSDAERAKAVVITGGCTCLFRPPDDDLNTLCPPHQNIAAALAAVREEATREVAVLLDDLARDAAKTPGTNLEQRALMTGAVAAYRSAAAAIRGQEDVTGEPKAR